MAKRRPIGLKDIAAELNLSVTTVSRAMAGYSDVSEATRQRVMEAAAAHGYVPNRMGRMLVSGRSNFIGMVLPLRSGEVIDAFMGEFMVGLSENLTRRQLDLFLAAVPPDHSDMDTLRHMVDGLSADAVVINRITRDDPRVRFLIERKVPFVAHGRVLDHDLQFPWIDTSGEEAFRELAHLLADLGHTRFAVLGPDLPYTYAHFRRLGLEQGLADRGLALDPNASIEVDVADREAVVAAVARLLDLDPRPTAIVCLTDRLAFAAMEAARQRGLVIPRDLSVTGFDDVPTAAYAGPALTTFSQRIREVTASIAEMLEMAITAGNDAVPPRLIAPTFIPRGSHGPAPDPLARRAASPERRHQPGRKTP